MNVAAALSEILLVEPPWYITRHEAQDARLDVYIAPGKPYKTFLGGSKLVFASGPEQVWRHTDVEGKPCFVHVVQGEELAAGMPWAGQKGLPYTRALAQVLIQQLQQGQSMADVCRRFQVKLDELWQHKFAYDQAQGGSRGQAGGAFAESTLGALAGSGARAFSLVPPAAAPVWARLVQQDCPIEVRALNLKLLLAKLRSQMALRGLVAPDRTMTAEVHAFFVLNERNLGFELEQLGRL